MSDFDLLDQLRPFTKFAAHDERAAQDAADITKRLNAVMNIGYQGQMTATERAALLQEYLRSVAPYPAWAVHNAVDSAKKSTPSRRPEPGEITIHCERAIAGIKDEITWRKRKAEAENATEANASGNRVSGETAERIKQEFGFTVEALRAVHRAPMAKTIEEAREVAQRPNRPHWTETVSPDDPRLRELQQAREANPIMRAARASAERRRQAESESQYD